MTGAEGDQEPLRHAALLWCFPFSLSGRRPEGEDGRSSPGRGKSGRANETVALSDL